MKNEKNAALSDSKVRYKPLVLELLYLYFLSRYTIDLVPLEKKT
jgi:hypothetical protein